MNERIKLLAEQARKALATDAMSGGEFNMKAYEEKFAELIVRECIDVAKETRWAVPPSQEQIAKGIQQHFGVKE